MVKYRGGAGNFAANPERASEAGRKGGKNSSGNFRNNPERAVEAGRKGGKSAVVRASSLCDFARLAFAALASISLYLHRNAQRQEGRLSSWR